MGTCKGCWTRVGNCILDLQTYSGHHRCVHTEQVKFRHASAGAENGELLCEDTNLAAMEVLSGYSLGVGSDELDQGAVLDAPDDGVALGKVKRKTQPPERLTYPW